MIAFPRKPLTLALVAAFSTGSYGIANGALLSLSQTPLFVTSAQKANVLLIYSNSNAMDEDPTGLAVGSDKAESKSEISRVAARGLVSNYQGQINMGLMAYEQTNVKESWLYASAYDASYDPNHWNPAWTGARDSTTNKKFRIPNPTSPNASGSCTDAGGTKVNCVYYNVNLPFYHSVRVDTDFCYSTKVGSTGYVSFAGDHTEDYYCSPTKTGKSNAAPGTGGAGYGTTSGPYSYAPTDSDFAQAIDDFGQRVASFLAGTAWFSNAAGAGKGYLHIPIANLDASQAGKLNTKLAISVIPANVSGTWNLNPTGISGGNTPTNPNAPLINAGLSPITGTFLTAKDYYNGATTNFGTSQGGPHTSPATSCGKDFVVFLTNGLPSVRSDGSKLSQSDYVPGQPYVAAEVNNAVAAVGSLNSGTRPVKSYVVGFALPEFTNNYFVNNPPNPLDQMAAAGGTGSAYYANSLTTLNSTFSNIFSNIITESGAAAAVALTSGSVTAGGRIYQGQFNSSDWSGDLLAYNTDPTTGATTTIAWQAGQRLNSQNYDTGRSIITYKPSNKSGIPFRWPANPASPATTELDASQVTHLNTNISGTNDGAGSTRLNYLRGQTGIAGYRNRLISVLGDIVNSAPAYVGKPAFNYPDSLESSSYSAFRQANSSRAPMIYVGANDGMLHAFDAASGNERLAYVPSAVYPHLSKLTSTAYTHRYYVDGSPTVVDAFVGGAWRTMLVGTLGAGGQSVFALDVTNPNAFSEPNAANIVKWEFTHPDLGYVSGQPSIVKLNNGVWAAVFGNGYNNSEADGNASTTGFASLFIVNLETGALIKQISTETGSATTPNALAAPTLVDFDEDGKADYAYAGDLLGNMWKFDLCNATNKTCSSNVNGWGVAFGTSGSPQPLFVARDAGNNRQPITSAVEITRHFSGDGYQLYFGTGKYLELSDIATTTGQTFYSIWDEYENPSTISGRSLLQEQTVTVTQTVSGKNYRRTSSNPVAWKAPIVAGGTKRGWFLDLPVSGERIVSDPTIYDNRLLFTTLIPNSTVCGNGGTGWLMELDAVTGGAMTSPTFDVDGDGDVDESDHLGTAGQIASGVETMSIPSAVRLQKNPGQSTLLKPLSLSKKDPVTGKSLETILNGDTSTERRSSWRQIFTQ